MRTLVKLLASTAFIGYLPRASGTAASAAALGCLWVTGHGSALWWAIGTLLIGLAISKKATEVFQSKDPGIFVLDEWCGMAVTLIGLPLDPVLAVAGFFLFRFFDIAKPAGIRRLDRLNHPFGIMLDDVLAGLYSNLILQGLWRLWLKPPL
jgi:phosphatidylglycerophosphatase A